MSELFKTHMGKEPIRLASTSGHVVIVGEEWCSVPPMLVPEALKAGCMSKAIYDEAYQAAFAEAQKEVRGPKPKAPPQPISEERQITILQAIKEILDLRDDGREVTPGQVPLVSERDGKPRVAAVSELAGFPVTQAEINEALK